MLFISLGRVTVVSPSIFPESCRMPLPHSIRNYSLQYYRYVAIYCFGGREWQRSVFFRCRWAANSSWSLSSPRSSSPWLTMKTNVRPVLWEEICGLWPFSMFGIPSFSLSISSPSLSSLWLIRGSRFSECRFECLDATRFVTWATAFCLWCHPYRLRT